MNLDGIAFGVHKIAKAIEDFSSKLLRLVADSQRLPGQIDYSMAEIHDIPTISRCPRCGEAVWSYEAHEYKVRPDLFDRGEPCTVVQLYTKEN